MILWSDIRQNSWCKSCHRHLGINESVIGIIRINGKTMSCWPQLSYRFLASDARIEAEYGCLHQKVKDKSGLRCDTLVGVLLAMKQKNKNGVHLECIYGLRRDVFDWKATAFRYNKVIYMQFGVDSLGMITRARFANNSQNIITLETSVEWIRKLTQNWIFLSCLVLHCIQTKDTIILIFNKLFVHWMTSLADILCIRYEHWLH